MPKMYDFIHEDAYALLAMQYIEGESLYTRQQSLNPYCTTWVDLNNHASQTLIGYAIRISEMIVRMHKAGYIHRDIMPVNFLIDKQENIYFIDLELTWSPTNPSPHPPFTLGTPGFAAPEQMNRLTPQFDHDTYSVGALLVFTLTNITPIRFTHGNLSNLNSNLLFFLGDKELTSVLTNCLSPIAAKRPSLHQILTELAKYRGVIQHGFSKTTLTKIDKPNDNDILEMIHNSLDGLSQAPLVLGNDLWCSKRTIAGNSISGKSKQYAIFPGLGEGIAGPLYVLARLFRAGVSVNSHETTFLKAWRYLSRNHLQQPYSLKPGLYYGAAGIAMALAEALNSGLLPEDNQYCLSGKTISSLLHIENNLIDLSTGVAGQGIATLRCAHFLSKENQDHILSKTCGLLLAKKPLQTYSNNPMSADFISGDIGLLWFMLDYASWSNDPSLKKQLTAEIDKILKSKKLIQNVAKIIATRESYDTPDGCFGVILLLLKAYEVLENNQYKAAAIRFLLRYPDRIAHYNFTQANGLAGLGELYLEAARITGEERWRERAHWILNVFFHLIQKSADNVGYWVLEEHNPPTADLLTGVSGIIHFLARCLYPTKIGYRMLT